MSCIYAFILMLFKFKSQMTQLTFNVWPAPKPPSDNKNAPRTSITHQQHQRIWYWNGRISYGAVSLLQAVVPPNWGSLCKEQWHLFSSATHGWSNQEIMDREDKETSGKQWLLWWHWLHVGNGSSHKQALHCRWQWRGRQEHLVKKEMIGDRSFWQPFQTDGIIRWLFFFFRCTRNPRRWPRRQRRTSSTFSATISTIATNDNIL
jgi:hypothetical protein